jgi:hypothetical protein
VTRATFPTGLVVEARARSISPAYTDSGLAASTIGLNSVQLQTPVITPSAPNFVAGSVETISIRLTDLNSADSTLQYRIGAGSWQTYSAQFNVTRAAYASGLTVTARAISTSAAYTNSAEASSTIGLTAVRLQAPVIGTSASNFVAASVETISITLTNPNSTGSALDYRINEGSWQAYSAAFNVTRTSYPSGLTVEGRARATQAAYTDSTISSATIGLTAVRLQTPTISPSAPNFVAGTVETISVTITNPNATGSALDYRINGGSWQAYTTALSVTRASYASGLTVEARARATSSAYSDSAFASSVIGLTPVQLRTPSIALSAPNFIAASVETIAVTITNPNTTGSALEYRINAGSWTAYTAALSVTRTTYASGLTVEARARATQAAYTDSTSASASIGLTAVQLRTPTISPSRSDFIAGTVETISVTITNPNTTGSTLQYRLNSGTWTNYTAAFNVTRTTYPSGVLVEARALSTNVAYTTSDSATSTIGLSSVQLRTPTITPTAPNFAAGSVETINVSISNPNATGSVLEYRLNTGAWQTYTATFTLTRASYPSGATVEARARSTSAAFTNSDNAIASLGLTAVPLVAPTISPSSPNFMAGSVETISVSISNPNATGSILEYRLNTGSWTTYSSAFSVTRSSYPSGLTVEARARSVSAAYTTSATTTSTIGLTAVQLQAPTITRSFPNFVSGSVETVTITLTNPNPSGSSTLQYRLAGGAWTNYGSAFNLSRSTYPSGVIVEARARTASAAYLDSTSASVTIGVGAVQLQPPTITRSAPNFMAGSVETISVSLTNPNPSGSSTMQYRLNSGSWQNYSNAFNVTRSNYPSGLTIDARARASTSAYIHSTNSTTTIGLTPVQLQTPTISPNANNFMAGSVDSISVSITNPNASGSALEYRLAGGSWISYSGSFTVSRTSYPSGVIIEARARSTSAAFSDSLTASRSVGLTPVQLQSPTIRKSAPYFAAGVVETVSITIINPNSTGSSLEYRLNGGSWLTYSNAFNVTRATYANGVTIEARARATSAAYLDSPVASATVAVNTDPVQRVTVTFSSMSSSAGYLNESFIYVNGDGYYLGNSDMGAGFTVNVDVYVNPYVTNVFDLTIDTYMRSGSNVISGALRGMDTRNGSQFTVISSNASFAGAAPNAGKIKDLSTSSNLRMVVGYEDLIITGGSPDYDYDDFQFEVRAPANFNLIFGGYYRGL